MTVGSAVALTLVGVAYWMIPYLTGRALWGRKLAVASSWTYTIGVLIFARGMASAGLEGMPRRIYRAAATYSKESWDLGGALTGIGGTLMFLGLLAFFVVIGMTVLFGRKEGAPTDIPFAETLEPPARTGWAPSMDRLGWWVAAAVVLILIAYGPFFAMSLPPNNVSPPYTFF
jgi:cytochrome c oxidase subunit 1